MPTSPENRPITRICLALTIIAFVQVMAQVMAGQVIESQGRAAASAEIVASLESLEASLCNAEAVMAEWGSAPGVTHRPADVSDAQRQVGDAMGAVRRLIAVEPTRTARCAALTTLIQGWLDKSADCEGGIGNVTASGAGVPAQARDAIKDLVAAERLQGAKDLAGAEAAGSHQRIMFLLAILLEIGVLAAGYRLLTRQLAERRRADAAVRGHEDRLRHDALHDALTGLPNRAMFIDRVERCIGRAKRRGDYNFAVFFIDLDRFKVINDSLGHAAGDQVLLAVAAALSRCVRPPSDAAGEAGAGGPQVDDIVARLGGDEFTLLVGGLRAPADAVRLAEQLQAEVSRPLVYNGHETFTTASIGIVYGDARYETARALLRDADTAMYRAKSTGKARHAVFETSMHDAAVARLRLESDLRRALAQREFELQYQPIVSLSTREVLGFEALIRWRHDGRVIPPADFIPVAEEMGLISQLGAWVLDEAVAQLKDWVVRYPQHASLSMSVNVSRRQLSDASIVEDVRRVLWRTGVAAGSLKLEITENAVMDDPATAQTIVGKLKALGVQVQMDDFGMGQSSLSSLHQFSFDALKIDRAFVTNAGERRDHAAVIQAIVSLAHNFGAYVVAEGIETAAQVALLQAMNCDCGQGFFFAKSLSAEAAEAFMNTAPVLSRAA